MSICHQLPSLRRLTCPKESPLIVCEKSDGLQSANVGALLR